MVKKTKKRSAKQPNVSRSGSSSSANPPRFPLSDYLKKLGLGNYFTLSQAEKREFVRSIDPKDMKAVLTEIKRQSDEMKLENEVLGDFLQKTDSSLLEGLEEIRAKAYADIQKQQNGGVRKSVKSSLKRAISKIESILSNQTTLSSKDEAEPKINVKAKIKMCKKLIEDTEKELDKVERKASHTAERIKVRKDVQIIQAQETNKTLEIFKIHFVTNPSDLHFLESATTKQQITRLRTFTDGWMKCAGNLLGTMRQQISIKEENIRASQQQLMTYKNMQLMKNKRAELGKKQINQYLEKVVMKFLNGAVSTAKLAKKQSLDETEAEIVTVSNTIEKATENILKLNVGKNLLKHEILKDTEDLNTLRQAMERRIEAYNVVKDDDKLIKEKEEQVSLMNEQHANDETERCQEDIKEKKEESFLPENPEKDSKAAAPEQQQNAATGE